MGRPKITPPVKRKPRPTLTSQTPPKETRGRKPIGDKAMTPNTLRNRKKKLTSDKRKGNQLGNLIGSS